MNKIRAISLLSGAGGMDLGFIRAGIEVVWANDFDKNACDTYKANIGSHITCCSILDIDYSTLPDCDLIFGGPPCQGFSVAGKMQMILGVNLYLRFRMSLHVKSQHIL